MKKYIRDYACLFLTAGIVIIFDQWTKNLVRDNLSIGEIWVPWDWVAPYARIIHWQNTAFEGKANQVSWIIEFHFVHHTMPMLLYRSYANG